MYKGYLRMILDAENNSPLAAQWSKFCLSRVSRTTKSAAFVSLPDLAIQSS